MGQRGPVAVLPRTPGGPRGASGRINAVDGLRAVALGGVIAFHYGLGLPGGFLSVDLFFVISGYVITRLLMIEWQKTGSIDWLRFWARRARRLMPAVAVLLVAVQVVLRTGALPELRSTTDAQTVAALGYVSNWYAIVADVGYWGAAVDDTPLTHLWTLAVEEQFYLVWPLVLILVLALTRSRRALAAVAGVGAALSYAESAVMFGLRGSDRAYLGTDTRIGALLLGALCALLLTRRTRGADGWDRRLPAAWAPVARPAALFAVASLTLLWATARVHSGWTYRGGLLAAALADAVLVALVVAAPGRASARVFGSRVLVWAGLRSYSLYLWHWPVHVYVIHRLAGAARPVVVAVELAATLVLGTLSYTLVERTTRHIRRPLVLAPPLLACGLLALGSAVLAHPKPPAERQGDVIVHGSP